MFDNNAVADHYSHGKLVDAIRAAVRDMGNTPETITVDDLAAVDEFHIGGRTASVDLLGQLGLSSDHHVLDVGCGLGGTARFLACNSGCKVSGIDLTADFIETGKVLCSWVGLAERIDLHCGSALAMPFEASRFDAAVMLHVGMNIEDKAGLFAEVNRVLRPGGLFGVYDIMRQSDDPLVYPVPWATVSNSSSLGTPQDYRNALSDAGFEITKERDRREFATEFFAGLRKSIEAAGAPPPLGLHILLGETAAIKVRNMVDNVTIGRVSPVEMIARKI
jgi:ubiquinone/menaquinone biosynthesis C-methylase UbiE